MSYPIINTKLSVSCAKKTQALAWDALPSFTSVWSLAFWMQQRHFNETGVFFVYFISKFHYFVL